MIQLSQLYVTPGKTIALAMWTFVGKVMSLLFNTLCRFVIAFLPGSKSSSNFMAAVTILSGFRAQEEEICHSFHLFPVYLLWSDGKESMILAFLILSFRLLFSLPSFTLINRLFSSSSLSAITMLSLIAQLVKNPPAMKETLVRFLGQEDLLER